MNEFLNIITNYFIFDNNQQIEALILAIVQLLIIFFVLFITYRKFIKGTSSEKLVRGIIILIFGWLLGEVLIKLNLHILGAFLRGSIGVIAISLVVIFQPELRKFLSYIGQTDFWKKVLFSTNNKNTNDKVNLLKELTETVKYLSKTKTGGLIVLQPNDSHYSFSQVGGTKLNAIVSAELLLTIFFHNTPLHDGAVLIQDEKIIYAGLVLPLTGDPQLSWRYGTRHRAAIGVTEVSNCSSIVVSEETGDISIAFDGILKKFESIADFKEELSKILKIEENKPTNFTQKAFDFINFKPKDKNKKILP